LPQIVYLIGRGQDDGAGLQLRIFEPTSVLQELGFRGHRPGRRQHKLSKEILHIRERASEAVFIAERPLLNVLVRTEIFNASALPVRSLFWSQLSVG
jgi:hypothetical protein